MKKVIAVVLLAFLQILPLSAASEKTKIDPRFADRDMDGVIDRDDRCPDTPFLALVDRNGCTVETIKVSKEQEESLKKILSQSN